MISKSSSNVTVATVGGVGIPYLEYQRNLNAETEKLRQMLGTKYSPELLKSINLGADVLQRMVDNRLLVLESKRMGIRISDEEIAKKIRSSKEFADRNGNFSKEVFAAILKRTSMTENGYIEKLRDEMAVRLLISTVTSSVSVPPNAATTLISGREEQRSAEIYTIPSSLIKTIPAPTEQQLKDYYHSHIGEFTAPEYRKLSYVVITADDAKKYIKDSKDKNTTNANIENIYRDRIEEFKKPERRKIDQLLFGNEEAAVKAYQSIKSGKQLADVGKDSNILNPKSISLGIVEKTSLMQEAADKVFALPKGVPSEPIKSAFGWHVFEVTEIVPAATLSLEEVRPRIEKELEQQANDNAMTSLSNNVEDSIAGGSTLSETAKDFGFNLITLPAVDKSGKLDDGTVEKTLPDEAKFLETAFKTDEKTESAMINGKGGKNYILRVESITPEHVKPLEEVKEKVSATWIIEEKKKQLASLAKKISAAFADPAGRATAIKTNSLPEPSVVTVSQKNDDSKKLPASMISDIFSRPVGGSSAEFELANGDYAIAVVKEIIPVKLDEKDSKYASDLADVNNDYKNSLRSEAIEQYLHYLASKYKITVNATAMQIKGDNESEE